MTKRTMTKKSVEKIIKKYFQDLMSVDVKVNTKKNDNGTISFYAELDVTTSKTEEEMIAELTEKLMSLGD